MPTISYPTAATRPRQQGLNYTPPGGVFDPFGNRVESFGASSALPFGSTPGVGIGMPGQGQVSNPVWQRRDIFGNQTLFPAQNQVVQPVNPVFTSNPQPQTGTGPFGQVPGPIGVPDVYGNLQKPVPILPQLNSAAAADILSNLHGELSPATQAAIQDAAARFGISSGMPGSGLARNKSLRDIGLTSEQIQAQGLQQLNPFLSTVSGTQTVRPETQIGLAETNAINASAPNPQAQSSYAEQLFNKYLSGVNGPNPAGGTGVFGTNRFATGIAPDRNISTGGFSAPASPFSPYGVGSGIPLRANPWDKFPWAKRGFSDYATYG